MLEDIEEKYNLYVDKLGVKEYFLFDPNQEYLKPSFQGYRKVKDRFRPIKPIEGRLPSKELGLHLERAGVELRLWNPADGTRLPTPGERANIQAERAEQEAERAEQEAERAEQEAERAEQEAERARQAEEEIERLRREIERLRGKPGGK
jgi:predicted ribosome quality control (RQC) complex YloA/Tae2 family protein